MAFRHRDRELEALDRALESLPRHHLHALITGLRQVGKTALAIAYQEQCRTRQTPSLFVQGAHVTHPAIFLRAVYEGCVDTLAGTHVASTSLGNVLAAAAATQSPALAELGPLYQQTWDGTADPSASVQAAWQLPERLGRERQQPVVAVIDEVQEIFHQFARSAPYRGGGGVDKAAWDARGQIQHNDFALWVFTTSLRNVVEQFFRKSGSPFYLQTQEIRLEPLSLAESTSLLRELVGESTAPTQVALERIAELSGGLPGVLIQLLADCPPGAGKPEVEAIVQASIRTGRLAALYTDITSNLTREGRYGSRLLLQSLHALARGCQTPKPLARRIAVTAAQAANLLLVLEQLGLVEKIGPRSRRLRYPLMREWLLSQPAAPVGEPASEQELRVQLGFGFEARVREVLSLLKRPLTLTDTAEGELLLRPGASLTLGPFRSVRRRPTEPETDVIAEEGSRTLVLGCRCRREHTSGETIRQFSEQQVAAAARAYPGVWGMFVSASGFTQGAVQEANAREIYLLTLRGLNAIAQAVGEHPFSAP